MGERKSREDVMNSLSSALHYLLIFSGLVSAVLVTLIVYGNTLDSREDEEIYLNKREEAMMAGDQPALIRKMNRLARAITVVATITGVTLLASAGIWVYLGLFKS
jgi:hypothetical protein